MNDLERRLEELFASDARARRIERVRVEARRRGGPLASAAFVGAVSLAVVAAIVVISTLRPPREEVATTLPSGSPAATSAATPSATVTAGTEYVNPAWGYAVTLPEPYRRSERFSFPASPGVDRFTALSPQAEQGPECHANCAEVNYTAVVWFESGVGAMSARDFYAAGRAGKGEGQRLEDVTIAGQRGLKVEPGTNYVVQYIVPDGRGGMFVLSYQIAPQFAVPGGASEEKLRAIIASFRFTEIVGAQPSAKHGFITQDMGGKPPILRTEADAKPLRELPAPMIAAASRDGRRVAYVRIAQPTYELVVFDAATPTNERTVARFSGDTVQVQSIVWSSAGTDEVMLAVHDWQPGPPVDIARSSRLVVVDLATGAQRELARITGLTFHAVAYRGADGAAAVEIGPGGFGVSYVYVRGGAVSRWPMPSGIVAMHVTASRDGTKALHLGPLFSPPRGVSWWPIDDYGKRRDLSAANEDVSAALWRPGADELVVFVSPTTKNAKPGPRIEVWTTAGQRRVVREGATLAVVRVDGTAALTTDAVLIDLVTGAATPLPGASRETVPYLAVAF